ncbi:hypothetical protein HHI36_001220 [Cryptolaemus montrouzieri]|uniref:Uncharacterized protein n=1 Tax=Cryptolaemus montrouzieri TaxID=559131 RepID=A0ABD2P710_9CUCU
MNSASPGIYSRVTGNLTPKLRKPINQVEKEVANLSFADLVILKDEIMELKKQAMLNKYEETVLQLESFSPSIENNQNNTKIRHECTYSEGDSAPFTIFAEGKRGNVGHLNPLQIGKLFFTNDSFNYNIIKIGRKGRNRVGVDFTTAQTRITLWKKMISLISTYICHYHKSLVGI